MVLRAEDGRAVLDRRFAVERALRVHEQYGQLLALRGGHQKHLVPQKNSRRVALAAASPGEALERGRRVAQPVRLALIAHVAQKEVQQEGFALAEGSGDRDHHDGLVLHVVGQQDAAQSILVQLEAVVILGAQDLHWPPRLDPLYHRVRPCTVRLAAAAAANFSPRCSSPELGCAGCRR
uniref:Uncharacterized protein n=1 Tax=Rhipicephalus microplus TaxID=6941 RepID=A0A6G5AHK8_RHIMP